MKNYKPEAFDIWHYACKAIYEPLIRCRIDFSNRLDENLLKEAVRLSFGTIPMISCRFDTKSRHPRWIEGNFTGEDVVHVVAADENTDKQTIALLSANIDFSAEPQLKMYLIRKTDGDTLCAIINHMICDAAGFKEYLYLLCELYTKLKNNAQISVPAMRPRGINKIFSDISLLEKLRFFCSYSGVYDKTNKESERSVRFSDENRTAFMETNVISQEALTALKAFGKKKGATLNDIIMTAFAGTFCRAVQTDTLTFPCTMDLRKYIPAGGIYGITNLSINCTCNLSVRPQDSFDDTLKQVSSQMQFHKSNRNVLKSVFLWDLLVKILPFRFIIRNHSNFVKLPVISFTNLGILDDKRLKFGDTVIKHAYLTASIRSSPYFQMTASTYNNQCTLSCNIYGDECDRKWVQDFLENVSAELSSQLHGGQANL